jgi:hypothetical protein
VNDFNVSKSSETVWKSEVERTTASDFKEDPFQNYRYEDPFLISDPFTEPEEQNIPVKGEKKTFYFLFFSI